MNQYPKCSNLLTIRRLYRQWRKLRPQITAALGLYGSQLPDGHVIGYLRYFANNFPPYVSDDHEAIRDAVVRVNNWVVYSTCRYMNAMPSSMTKYAISRMVARCFDKTNAKHAFAAFDGERGFPMPPLRSRQRFLKQQLRLMPKQTLAAMAREAIVEEALGLPRED